jgi:hypothetical protein
VRSRSKWITEGEKCTKYFLSLEKYRQKQNVINELEVNNKYISKTSDIINAMCNFHENLYSSQNISDDEINEYLESVELENEISDDDIQFCEEFPSLEECTEAVQALKLNKAPELDGLTNEFYKVFWVHIKDLFYDTLRGIYRNNKLSYTQKLAIISLIFKKRDTKDLKKITDQ